MTDILCRVSVDAWVQAAATILAAMLALAAAFWGVRQSRASTTAQLEQQAELFRQARRLENLDRLREVVLEATQYSNESIDRLVAFRKLLGNEPTQVEHNRGRELVESHLRECEEGLRNYIATIGAWRQFGGDRETWQALVTLGDAIRADVRTLEELASERLNRDNRGDFVTDWTRRVEDTWLNATVAAVRVSVDEASSTFFKRYEQVAEGEE